MPRGLRPQQHQQRRGARAQRRLRQRLDFGQRELSSPPGSAPQHAAGEDDDDGERCRDAACGRSSAATLRAGRRGERAPAGDQRRSARGPRQAASVPAMRRQCAKAMSMPSTCRTARLRHGASTPILSDEAEQQRDADRAAAAGLASDQPDRGDRDAGMQHARQAAVVGDDGCSSKQRVRQRPRERPGQRRAQRQCARRHRARRRRSAPAALTARCTVAPVHPGRAPPAPRLRPRERRAANRARASAMRRQLPTRQRRPRAAAAARARSAHQRDARGRAQPNTARHSASTASRCAASVAGATCVGCSSSRARCCARRSSR